MIDTCQHIVDASTYSNTQIDSLLIEQGAQLDTISHHLGTLISHGTDYAPEVKVYALSMIIAVMAFMIPMLFTMVIRIDEKYATREFRKIFLHSCPLIIFYVLAPLSILVYFAYALLRMVNNEVELGLRILLCILATSLLIDAFWGLKKALDFCNEKSLLHYIKKRFLVKHNYANDIEYLISLSTSQNTDGHEDNKSRFAPDDSDLQRFYSIMTHLICYAFEKNVAFLYDIRNVLIEHFRDWKQYFLASQIKKTATIPYYNDVYELLCYISSAYKKNKDDSEINAIFANIFISLFDVTGNGKTDKNSYNALFQALVSCINNEHDLLINNFQRGLRTIYVNKKERGSKEDAHELLVFAIILNATLYEKERMECVDDAIDKNFDAVIIGDSVILPPTTHECLRLYIYLMNQRDENWHSYVYTLSNFTSATNYTQLHKALTEYFAYLAISQYRENEENYGIEYVDYYASKDIKNSLDSLKEKIRSAFLRNHRNRLPIVPEDLITSILDKTLKAKAEYIKNTPIDPQICRHIVVQSVEQKRLLDHFKNVVAYEDNPLSDEMNDFIDMPHWESYEINRACVLAKDNIMLEDFDFGSRLIEHFIDSIANVYNTFEREEEFVSHSRLLYRVTQYFKQYDCSFITVGTPVPPFSSYCGSHSFTQLFPLHSIIVIQNKDLPRLEWRPDNISILSINECENNENENNVDDMPKVKLAVSVGARIVYNKNTKIHILRTV